MFKTQSIKTDIPLDKSGLYQFMEIYKHKKNIALINIENIGIIFIHMEEKLYSKLREVKQKVK